MSGLPANLASPIIDEAKFLRKSQSTYTCSALAAYTTGNFVGVKKSSRLDVKSFELGALIDAVESQGWTLMSIDHVSVTATSASSGAFGHESSMHTGEIRAQMVFRAK